MQKDSVELIREAEQKAQQTIAEARRLANQIVSDARAKARSEFDSTVASAQTAADEALAAAKADGASRAEGDKGRYLEQGQKLQKKASGRREQAVEAVLEAIING